jgi:hypothetical protein
MSHETNLSDEIHKKSSNFKTLKDIHSYFGKPSRVSEETKKPKMSEIQEVAEGDNPNFDQMTEI